MDPTVAFLLQMALILAVARIFSELFKRMQQPPILGELLAGIVLGPSLLGALWPAGFQAVFTERAALEHMSTMGLILLMLLTGLETDIRVLRNMGRAAFTCSVFGMLIPFASGVALGALLDERFVLHPEKERLPLALFLATAMAVSAMPVIAKILMDLKMIRRNFGIVSLSAAVVDDTIGWIVLAIITGLITGQAFNAASVFQTLGLLAMFIAFARYALYPVLRWALPRVEHDMHVPGGELAVIVVTAFFCAAATEAMHVHAVFGAFVVGILFRQCPTLSAENLHRLEGVTMALFAPLFFGAVGLRVDLRALTDFKLGLLVLAIAVSGKVIGCYLGGIVGRMPRWEALAVGFCMSARGAVGLVVAKIGLDLNIINTELFAILVLMAIVTSFLAPLMVRAIVHKLPLSEEEKLREKPPSKSFVPSGQLKILLPAAGGENAVLGAHLAASLCRAEGDRCTALYVETAPASWLQKFLSGHRDVNVESYFKRLKTAAAAAGEKLLLRRVPASGSVLETILAESRKGYHFLFIGASGHKHPVYDPFVSTLVKQSPCHVAIISGGKSASAAPEGDGGEPQAGAVDGRIFQRILVPTSGSFYSDAAFEVAALYAQASQAHISVLYISEGRTQNPLLPSASEGTLTEPMQELMRTSLQNRFRERVANHEKLDCRVRESDTLIAGLVDEIKDGKYDLVVLGAENKSLVERLYLGQHIEAAITEVPCPIAIVIPRVR
ncbi:MAG TPA: cation:proton antiporter [Planctomycetota bacterium]|nr:cation:proton antiporter [Planctomycetota bacterium]